MAGQGLVSVVMDSEKGAFGMPSKTFSYKMTAILVASIAAGVQNKKPKEQPLTLPQKAVCECGWW